MEGRQQRASPEFGGREEKVEEGRFLTLLPLEVVLERVTPLKERGLPNMTSEEKGEGVKKYSKFADKPYIFCRQRGG